MPHSKIPDYYPVRITWLENAVENSGILEKSGVSDYTLFGMSMPERSWSLPDACNTYTSLYYDNMLDIDCWVDCGTWVPYGTSSFATCHTSQGYLQIGLYGNLTRGAYTEFDTETDSTYVMSMYITGYNTLCTWEVSVRDAQGNTIVAHTVTQTGTLNLEFTAVGSKSRVYVRRLSSTVTFGSFGLRTLSIDGKYHKEDVMYLSYRYGFQNQEKDDEIKGEGNSINFKYRMHDPRTGRFFSVDPLTKDYPHYTPYSFSGNKLINSVELEGLEEHMIVYNLYYDSHTKGYITSHDINKNIIGAVAIVLTPAIIYGCPIVAPYITQSISASVSFGLRYGAKTMLGAGAISNQVMNTGNRLMLSNPESTGNWMSFGSSFLIQENAYLLFNPTSFYPSLIGTGLSLLNERPDHFKKGILDLRNDIENISLIFKPFDLSSIDYSPEAAPAVSTSTQKPFIREIDLAFSKRGPEINFTPHPTEKTPSKLEERPTIGPEQ